MIKSIKIIVLDKLKYALFLSGRLIAHWQGAYKVEFLCFFPGCSIGGAEKIHLHALRAIKNFNKIIYFTDPRNDSTLLDEFKSCGEVCDISYVFIVRMIRPFLHGYISGRINKSKTQLTILGSNSGFFYELSQHLSYEHKVIDIIHAFGGGFEFLSLNYVHRINKRIVVSQHLTDELKNLYSSRGINRQLCERIEVIENAVDMPFFEVPFTQKAKLNVLYVGRGSPEKRIHLIGKIAARCNKMSLPFEFTVLGDSGNFVCIEDRHLLKLPGEVKNTQPFYSEADILIMTSSREGFPLVIMEAMHFGLIPICVDVGGINKHVGKDAGILIENNHNEITIVDLIVETLSKLAAKKGTEEIYKMRKNSQEYAKRNFRLENLRAKYLSALTSIDT